MKKVLASMTAPVRRLPSRVATAGALRSGPPHHRPADGPQVRVDVAPAALRPPAINTHGQLALAPVARAPIGHDLDGVRDVGELFPQQVEEVATPCRDDEEDALARH
jgi:hypothetical protein